MKSRAMTIAIFSAIALVLIGIFYLWHIVLSKSMNPALATDRIRVGSATFTVELATTTVEQARGLSFRANLAEGAGMLFIFSPGIQHFWMKDMNFPIDIIWIAGGKVVGFAANAEPQPGVPLWGLTIYNSPDGVDRVLEVSAGAVAQYSVKIGDVVTEGLGTK